MTWRVDESNFLAVFFYLIRTNVLRNSTSFASNYICRANTVEQRGFTVVNVTHNCDDRWTSLLQCLIIIVGVIEQCLQFCFLLLTWIDKKNFCTNFKRKQFHLIVAQCHGGCHHFTVLEQVTNNVCCCAI